MRSYIRSVKVMIVGTVIALASAAGAVSFSTPASAESRECGDNAVIRCGAMSASELRSEYAKNDRGLKQIFSYYNIDASDIAASGSAKTGYVHTDGTVTVDGKVVATNAHTTGRSASLGGHKVKINDRITVYEGADRLKSTLSAFVFFNADGTFKSAVIKVCGNPVKATPKPKPVYKCESLKAAQITRTKFEFTTVATAKNGATIKDYVYAFGDGQTATDGVSVTHEYAQPGTYTASVKVRVNVNGNVVTAPGECTLPVTVKPADKPGINITKTVNGGEHATVPVGQTFTYQIVVTNTGNIALKDAVVTDIAPREVTLVSASAGTVSGQTWTYTIPTLAVKESMTFTITAKYTAYSDGTHKNTVCVETPTIPGNPDDCDEATTSTGEKITVCDTNTNETITIDRSEFDSSHMTTDQSKCEVTELPETGIADLLNGGIGLSGLVGATYYYVNSRRSLR